MDIQDQIARLKNLADAYEKRYNDLRSARNPNAATVREINSTFRAWQRALKDIATLEEKARSAK